MKKKKINWKHPVFEKIYIDNIGKCMITGNFIPLDSVINWNYHHIEPKSTHPELMYDEKNIVFCETWMHTHLENMTKEKYHKLVKLYPKLKLYFDINKLK